MDENIVNFEPEIALFVPDENPLIFYHEIIKKARKRLKTGGYLYFEINELFGHQIRNILSDENYCQIELLVDIHNKHRIIKAVKT